MTRETVVAIICAVVALTSMAACLWLSQHWRPAPRVLLTEMVR